MCVVRSDALIDAWHHASQCKQSGVSLSEDFCASVPAHSQGAFQNSYSFYEFIFKFSNNQHFRGEQKKTTSRYRGGGV
jgi:hypothetical protein